MKRLLLTILFLLSLTGGYAEEGAYKDASAKLIEIPTEYNPTITDLLHNGWKKDWKITKIVNDNKEAIELFKKATSGESDGFIFGRRSPDLYKNIEIPSYSKEMQLFKLLLLEGKKYESKKMF